MRTIRLYCTALMLLFVFLYAPAHAGVFGTTKWTFNPGTSISSFPSIGPDGTIYIVGNGKNLHALNPDGTLKWTHQADTSIDRAPAIGPDGTIYLIEDETMLRAFSADGSQKWELDLGYESSCPLCITLSGDIYAAVQWTVKNYYRYNQYILDHYFRYRRISDQGEVLSARSEFGYLRDIIAYGDESVAFNGRQCTDTDDWNGACIDYAAYLVGRDSSGNHLWQFSRYEEEFTPESTVIHHAIIGPNKRYYFDYGDLTCSLRGWEDNGLSSWDTLGFGYHNGYRYYYLNPLATDEDGNVYCKGKNTNDDKTFTVVNKDVDLAWEVIGLDVTGVAIGADGTIFISTPTALYAAKSSDTDQWETITATLGNYASPALGEDGTLYVRMDGALHAISTSCGGLAKSSWPMPGQNAARTYTLAPDKMTSKRKGLSPQLNFLLQ